MSAAASKLGPVAKAQWLIVLRDGRLRTLAIATIMLAVLALVAGLARDTRLETERAALNAQDAQLWVAQGEVNPHMAAHFGRYVSKPVSPLTFFDPGVTEHLGTVARLEAHVQQPPRHRPSEGGTALSRFGTFSPALALQLLAPLLVILAGYASFSGERSRTLLRQELAGGARRERLLAGRYLSLGSAALLVTAPVLLIAVVVAARSGGDAVAASLALISGYALYVLVWVGLTLGVTALCRSARTSLIILLSLWLIGSFIVPRIASDVAERRDPTPSAAAFKAEIREALEGGPSGHDSSDERLQAYKQSVLDDYGVETINDLPVNWSGLALQEGERIATETGNAHYEKLWSSYGAQAMTRLGFSLLSPLPALRSWSSGLAGADAASHVDFSRALENYRFGFVKALNEDIAANADPENTWDYEAPIALLEETPKFHYTAPSTVATFKRLSASFAVLLAWALLSFLFARFAVCRLKPA